MSDTPSHAPVKSIMPKWIRGPQDFVGGVALMAIALFALWASSDLQGMRGFSFGAGTAPRMFGILLLVLGVAIALIGALSDGPPVGTYAWRGPLFVSLSILSFAVMIRPFGLVVSAFATFLISALGTAELAPPTANSDINPKLQTSVEMGLLPEFMRSPAAVRNM